MVGVELCRACVHLCVCAARRLKASQNGRNDFSVPKGFKEQPGLVMKIGTTAR